MSFKQKRMIFVILAICGMSGAVILANGSEMPLAENIEPLPEQQVVEFARERIRGMNGGPIKKEEVTYLPYSAYMESHGALSSPELRRQNAETTMLVYRAWADIEQPMIYGGDGVGPIKILELGLDSVTGYDSEAQMSDLMKIPGASRSKP